MIDFFNSLKGKENNGPYLKPQFEPVIDTHTHLYLPEFSIDQSETVQRAIDSGVQFMMMPNVDASTFDSMMQLHKLFPKQCLPMMGLHPCSVNENWESELKLVEDELFSDNNKYYGVGETGLDLFWDKTYFDFQKKALTKQLHWSAELQLPLIIHSRDATQEAIELIRNENLQNAFGIFHCFSGTLEQANQILELGFLLGIGGVVTFKNSGLDKVVSELPLSALVLETDSPYLAPVPHRGKRNESAYLPVVAKRIAELKQTAIEEVVLATTLNAKKLFHL